MLAKNEAADLYNPHGEALPRRRGGIRPLRGARATADTLPDVHPSLFGRRYEPQVEPFDSAFAVEMRGTYGLRWKPAWSRFGHLRGGGGHNGADIYGRVGTPVVASVRGRIRRRPGTDGEALGNRVWLAFEHGGRRFRFIYGHLDAFEGSDREVEAGEVIGYVGCSGNADYDGVCTADNRCGLRSSHVHLMLVDDGAGGGPMDPLPTLGWRVRYLDDQRDVPCRQTVAPSRPRTWSGIGPVPLAVAEPGAVGTPSLRMPWAGTLVERQGELLAQLESVNRLLGTAGEHAAELASWRSHLLRRLDDGNALAASPLNIDPNAPVANRVAAFWQLLIACTDEFDGGSAETFKDNVRRFMLHVAFWEGAELKARVQGGSGPARSFFQFEAHRAKDTLLYARQAHFLDELAQAAGETEQQLATAAGDLPSYGDPGSAYFPAGNLIEALLRNNDLFGIYLARVAFKKIPAAIPTGNGRHAAYWYEHWKVTGGNADQLRQQFEAKSDKADLHVP